MRNQRPRHEILGGKFNGTPSSWADIYNERFKGLGNYAPNKNPQIVRQNDITWCLGMTALHHLGYAVPADPGEFLNRGEGPSPARQAGGLRGMTWFESSLA